jgi:hypothetical protein
LQRHTSPHKTSDHDPAINRFNPDFVIPAKAGIQLKQAFLGSRLRGSDGFSDFLEIISDGSPEFLPNH